MVTGCGHRFHWRCYIEALSYNSRGCPMCRGSVQEAMPRFASALCASDSRNSTPLKRLGFAQ